MNHMEKMLRIPDADNPNMQNIRMLLYRLADDIDEARDKINGCCPRCSDMAVVKEVGMDHLVERYDATRLLIQQKLPAIIRLQILKATDKRKGGYDSDSSTSTLPPPYETSEMKLKRARRDESTL